MALDDRMRRISFYHGSRNKNDTLHVETDGAVINVRVGLHDVDGRQVTAISISPDDESRGGDGNGHIWVREGDRIVRLNEGETPLAFRAETIATAGSMTETVTVVDALPLRLSFEPEAIRQHFDGQYDLDAISDEVLGRVGALALSFDSIYEAFGSALSEALHEIVTDLVGSGEE